MGKGEVISGGKDGKYEINIVYNLDNIASRISAINTQILDINFQLITAKKEQKIILTLQKTGLEKEKAIIEAIPEKKQKTAWAVDLSEELSGDIGTIEIPDDPGGAVHIQPGYDDNSVYNQARDGQINPIMNIGPANAFLNLAIMPGVQKWNPGFRYGTIESIEKDKCSVSIEAATDTNGENINKQSVLSNVDIKYMNCNGAAFSKGDRVIVQFSRKWETPVVIGFPDNPKPCGEYVYVNVGGMCQIWDTSTGEVATDIKDVSGNILSMPTEVINLEYWLSKTSNVETKSFFTSENLPPTNSNSEIVTSYCNGSELADELIIDQTRTITRNYVGDLYGYPYFFTGTDDRTSYEYGFFNSGTNMYGGTGAVGTCYTGINSKFTGGLATIKRKYESEGLAHYTTGNIVGFVPEGTMTSTMTTTCHMSTPLGSGSEHKAEGTFSGHTGKDPLSGAEIVVVEESITKTIEVTLVKKILMSDTVAIVLFIGSFQEKELSLAGVWYPSKGRIYEVQGKIQITDEPWEDSGFSIGGFSNTLGAFVQNQLNTRGGSVSVFIRK